MAQRIEVSGMFGKIKGQVHTYFSGSPVIIDISGLDWLPRSITFAVISIDVVYNGDVVGHFRTEIGNENSISIDISSGLKAIWSDYDFQTEIESAQLAVDNGIEVASERALRQYYLRIAVEFLDSSDGAFSTVQCEDADGNTDIPGGQCLLGSMTEWERSLIKNKEDADVSSMEHTGVRNGDASTKPTSSPERVGSESITSWVDVSANNTKSIFYPYTYEAGRDDIIGQTSGWQGHAPIVLRDSVPYTDFLFVNRRGAVETCSGQMLEALNISVETKQYSRKERTTFQPSRSLMAISSGGRRSWAMSSGYQTREWAEWWTTEFLMARQWWMRYEYMQNGELQSKFVPVIVESAQKKVNIYDRTKQQMPHVDFTVTLALEG